MSSLMNEISARTQLASASQVELLLFDVGTPEVFGVNVFKVREVTKLPTLTRLPEADDRIEGLTNIRGMTVPVVDLPKILSLPTGPGGEARAQGTDKLIITEYNSSLQGFHVIGVDRIFRVSWSQVKSPPSLVRNHTKGAVSAVTPLGDGRMVLILDVEKILADIGPRIEDDAFAALTAHQGMRGKTILFADDSSVARVQIRKTLEKLGLRYIQATNGLEALNILKTLAQKAEGEGKTIQDEIQLVLSDIEMPDMDGFTLTRRIRSDTQLSLLPVILHSSLTGSCNVSKGEACGATDYVAKFNPKVLGEVICNYL